MLFGDAKQSVSDITSEIEGALGCGALTEARGAWTPNRLMEIPLFPI